ncbi:uncharacterized protein LOC113507051 isoform X3 [Trichoplusia ni]|uniref:Uncharacterized protein LOC113507051 isoform X3 n=1 Tax=Trichoplusia ni TaxID=7111 RepID=A0A7E5WZP7_TRINI|nr:uncharacterized protein LOC113507051 isoform X3 [Trichoplusia ni]
MLFPGTVECVERCAGKRSAIKDGGPLYRPLLSVTRGVQNVEMTTVGCRCVVVVAACVLAAALVSAQITFSRDWTGGKRAAPQLALDCGQFTRLCRHFVAARIEASPNIGDDQQAPPGAGQTALRRRITPVVSYLRT